jgi:D-galacturonate reductase
MSSLLHLQDELSSRSSSSNDASNKKNAAVADVLMIGTGEYTTGYVGGKGAASESDKGAGVVALSMMDMRSRNKVGRLAMCGVNGTKYPEIRSHMARCIADPYGLDVTCETFPDDSTTDPKAYKAAIASFQPGDVAIVFTPDDTHYEIAMECVQRGMHVMVTKPIVQTLEQHRKLAEAAARHNVLVAVEVRTIANYTFFSGGGERRSARLFRLDGSRPHSLALFM